MRITVLGSGTSSGVPVVGCRCATCSSTNPRDKRLRPSIMLELEGAVLVVDSASDFRQQMLQYQVERLDALVYTHHHYDHIAGFDDLRAFNFHSGEAVPIYALQETLDNLKRTFEYAFVPPLQIGGGVPQIVAHVIDSEPFNLLGITVQPIPMMHGLMRVNGYRFGRFAYCTDTNYIPDESLRLLKGLDVLILDALRYHEHPTHFTVDQAVEMAQRIGAGQTYFTHIAHQILHDELSERLPANIALAYDGLQFEL